MEALVATNPEKADPLRYEQALRGYLDAYPAHKSAFEARYRLGELLQAQKKFAEARAELAQVKGDPGFELQARFASLQCDFELFPAIPVDQRQAVLAQIDSGLQALAADVKALPPKQAALLPMAAMEAKAAIMRAVSIKLRPPIDQKALLAALAGIDETAKEQPELLLQAVKLRLGAYQEIGDFAAARAEVESHRALLAGGLEPRAIEELAVGFIRAGARDKAANDAAQAVALSVYELLPAEGTSASRTKLTLARLYENTGDLAKAAELYQQVLSDKGSSLSALRGLARIAEVEKRLPDAVAQWRKLGEQARAGDLPWYEASYEVARLTNAQGDKSGSCKQLTDLRPAMPGLNDEALRDKLTALYDKVCG